MEPQNPGRDTTAETPRPQAERRFGRAALLSGAVATGLVLIAAVLVGRALLTDDGEDAQVAGVTQDGDEADGVESDAADNSDETESEAESAHSDDEAGQVDGVAGETNEIADDQSDPVDEDAKPADGVEDTTSEEAPDGLQLQLGGGCMDAWGGLGDEGTQMIVFRCKIPGDFTFGDPANQFFKQVASPDEGWFHLEARHVDGMCVTIEDGSTTDQANAVLSACQGADHQSFNDGGSGVLQVRHSDLCLTVGNEQFDPGNEEPPRDRVVQGAC